MPLAKFKNVFVVWMHEHKRTIYACMLFTTHSYVALWVSEKQFVLFFDTHTFVYVYQVASNWWLQICACRCMHRVGEKSCGHMTKWKWNFYFCRINQSIDKHLACIICASSLTWVPVDFSSNLICLLSSSHRNLSVIISEKYYLTSHGKHISISIYTQMYLCILFYFFSITFHSV